jgi:hypothetical protein
MKKLSLILFLLFQLLSFGQEKRYNNFFNDCESKASPHACVLVIIREEVQLIYEKYRINATELYDLHQITIKYTITKNGTIVLESINGEIDLFKPEIIELFKKFPKVQPVVENGKTRDAVMTTSFYLYPQND